jgi:hypothetical protein
MTENKCELCKTGKKQLDNWNKEKNKIISKIEAEKLGSFCFMCIHNGIGKSKAWIMRKARPGFQSIDLFEAIE